MELYSLIQSVVAIEVGQFQIIFFYSFYFFLPSRLLIICLLHTQYHSCAGETNVKDSLFWPREGDGLVNAYALIKVRQLLNTCYLMLQGTFLTEGHQI